MHILTARLASDLQSKKKKKQTYSRKTRIVPYVKRNHLRIINATLRELYVQKWYFQINT